MTYSIFDKKYNVTSFGITLCIILIIISIFTLFKLYFYEKFDNQSQSQLSPPPSEEDYLYPVHSLNNICESQGLIPSHVNRLCLMKDNKYKPLANCKCEDKDGYCQICYDEINVDRKGRSVIYDANK